MSHPLPQPQQPPAEAAPAPAEAVPAQMARSAPQRQATRRPAATTVDHQPYDGGPPDGPGPEQPADRTGPSGRTGRLHVGWHTVARAELRRLTVTPPAGAGLILGRDRQNAPVPLPLFTPGPQHVALVGGVWAAQLLIFRAFSLGARVAVLTTEPGAWAGFGERATGQRHRLTVLAGEQPLTAPAGSAQAPVLAVYDLGVAGPVTAPALGAWHTRLTVLRQLDRPGLAALQDARFTLLQRLGGDETALACSALRLSQQSGQYLPVLADDMLALVGDGPDRYVFLGQTGVERQYVGPPRR